MLNAKNNMSNRDISFLGIGRNFTGSLRKKSSQKLRTSTTIHTYPFHLSSILLLAGDAAMQSYEGKPVIFRMHPVIRRANAPPAASLLSSSGVHYGLQPAQSRVRLQRIVHFLYKYEWESFSFGCLYHTLGGKSRHLFGYFGQYYRVFSLTFSVVPVIIAM